MANNFDKTLESQLPGVLQNGLITKNAVDMTDSPTVAMPAATTIGGSSVSALGIITSVSANALTAGANGATNPVFNVDASTTSVATGLNVIGAAAASGVALTALSSGTDETLNVNAKGAGLLTLNATATGNVVIGHGLTGTVQTLTGAGAVSITTLNTVIVSTGANALTLADGVSGQLKFLVMKTDGGDATLTPTTKTGFSTIVFNDAGDGCALMFTSTTGWIVFANNGCTIS